MGLFDFFNAKRKKNTTEKIVNISSYENNFEEKIDWSSLIKSEDGSGFNTPYYSLIMHKTNFFNDKDDLLFRGWELIIEIYSNEDYEEQEHNIYPELFIAEASIRSDKSQESFEPFVVANLPEYNHLELGNGLSRLAEGTAEDIANAINNLNTIDYQEFLPHDKLDFTYFFSPDSSIIIKTGNQDNGKVYGYHCELIGAEVYTYDAIWESDKKIKNSLDLENYLFLKTLVDDGYDKFDIPENIGLVKSSSGKINHFSRRDASLLLKDEDKEVYKTLALKYNKEDFNLRWYSAYKDFELPNIDDFLKDNQSEIQKLKTNLKLFYNFNYPAHEIILNKLRSFKICIWDIYPDIIYTLNSDHVHINKYIQENDCPRITIKEYDSTELYYTQLNIEDAKAVEKEKTIISSLELNKSSYKGFYKNLSLILEEDIVESKEKERLENLKRLANIKLSKEGEIHFNNAITEFNNELWEKSILEFNKCINNNPNKEEAFHNRALCKFELNDMSGALIDLEKAININNDEAEHYYMRGLTKSHLKNIQGALEDYNKTIELDKDNISAYLNRALIKTENDYLDLLGAISDYNKILLIENDNFKAFLCRAMTYQKLNNEKFALEDFLKVIELNSNYSYAYKQCVYLYISKNEIDKVNYYTDKYNELEPNDTDLLKIVYAFNHPEEEEVAEDLYYFEKVTHTSKEGLQYLEYALWSCWCYRGEDGEWDYERFGKNEFIEGHFYNNLGEEITIDIFDDFYDKNPESNWIFQFISKELDEVKNKMNETR